MANENGWGDGASNNDIGWGKGADNAIGWGSVYSVSSAGLTDIIGTPAVDPDAQAFITAASITDPTQQSAINQLVVDLKGYNIWSKMQAIYPMVGGTATTHKFNLKNPLDTNAAFRLQFIGGWTHSSNGALPNGTNAYADSFYIPNTNLADINSNHISIYSRTNIQGGIDMGAYQLSPQTLLTLSLNYSGAGGSNTWNMAAFHTHYNLDSRCFMINSRTASNLFKTYKNGTTLLSSTGAAGATKPNVSIWIGNSSGFTQYSSRQYAFASIGSGLTDTEAANFYTAVQAFQVTLGRSIGTQTVSDADAQAFVTNAGIVDQVEANAINNLVIGLKADSLWTKMKAVYPFVGGTSTTNSYNLKNTAQYQITWSGGVTHASTGVTFNGTNGYANTNFAPNSALTANSNHVALYSRTAAARSQTFSMDFGQGTDLNISNGIFGCSRRLSGNAIYGATNASAQGSVTAANTNGSGMFVNSITSSTSRKIYRNAVTLGTLTTNISQTLSAPNMFIGADNNNGSPNLYSDYQAAFFSIGDGLDDTEATNLNTRVTTFQTALNRNV